MAALESKIDGLPDRTRRLIRDLEMAPAPGFRHKRLCEVGFDCAEWGFTNDEILVVLRRLAEQWGVYPSTKLYRQWTKLLQILEHARQKYPNAPDGSGYKRVADAADAGK